MLGVSARILDGKAVAAQIRSEVAERVRALHDTGITPGLAAVLVGDDQASRIYVGQKHKACADVGIRSEQVDLPSYVTEHELLATIRRLNRDPEVHGIILQLPLPGHLGELEMQRAIAPEKDVDGLHPWNIGMMLRQGPGFLPATPYGIVELLLRSEIQIEGAEVTLSTHNAKVLARATTDTGGTCGLPLPLDVAPDEMYIIVQHAGYNIRRLRLDGTPIREDIRALLYGDR